VERGRDERLRIAAMELQLADSRDQPAYFHGYLMVPVLREGDEVEVETISWRDVRPGDVVTYRDADKFPTRRVMEIRSDERAFVIRGDGLRPRRQWLIPFDDVVGRVRRRRRNGRWVTTRHWTWRVQRARVLLRYRLASSRAAALARGARRSIARVVARTL
jgi:hypothetical protein